MLLIPTLERLGQVYLCEFKSSLIYIASSRIARAAWKTQLKNKTKESKTTNYLAWSRDGCFGAADAVLA